MPNSLHWSLLVSPTAQGFNKIYNWNLATSLKRIFTKHKLIWRGYPGPAKPELVPNCKTIREFDEAITVHSFGEYTGSTASAAVKQQEVM